MPCKDCDDTGKITKYNSSWTLFHYPDSPSTYEAECVRCGGTGDRIDERVCPTCEETLNEETWTVVDSIVTQWRCRNSSCTDYGKEPY